MMKTERGLIVTGSSLAMEHINDFHLQILSSGLYACRILDAAQQYPEHVLIQLYAAAFYLFGQESAATQMAQNHLLQAKKYLSTANTREKMTFQAIEAWRKLNYEQAILFFEQLVLQYPRDTLAIKFSEWLFYCRGQVRYAKPFLKLCEQVAADNEDDPYFLATYSFALELNGRYIPAQLFAEQAIQMQPISPWAHHTLAHIYLMNHQLNEGIKFLLNVQPTWNEIFPLLKGHNTWHLALFFLAKRDEEDVLRLFNQGIWGNMPATVLEQLDAISLLWRLDMAGLPQNDLFRTVLLNLHEHPYEQYTGFSSVHFIYCLARNNCLTDVNKALHKIETYSYCLKEKNAQHLWSTIILPFCKATAAFAGQDYHSAYEILSPIIERCFDLGGSDAQDELFLQMYLLCLLGCKKKKEADQFFNRYLSHYKNTSLAAYWFE